MMAMPEPAHLVAAPILLPLLTAALMVGIGERRWMFKAGLNVASMLASLGLAVWLLAWMHADGRPGVSGVYLPGNWPVPFGIVLMLDRLSGLLLVLAACAGLASLLFSLARWHRAGVWFHPLLQLQLMGLNGAFLTADLFNLFVFFEVLLAASYGLLLHGGGSLRVRAGLHYITVNLLASLLFLIGVALVYGVTGTLNMADIASKLPSVPATDRGLLHAGAALLAVAFLAKAAQWPLNFWLPPAYSAASAPSAAMFAILTKVGVYAVLRLWTLCFPAGSGDSAHFGGNVLIWGGLATMGFGAFGMLASHQLGRLAGYSVIASSGTVLAAIGFDRPALTGGALFYLASSVLAGAALFLLAELVERAREAEVDPPRADSLVGRLPMFGAEPPQDVNLDDEQVALIGRVMPAAVAFLGLAFLLCTLALAGLPPMSGFVGKVAMLSALLEVGPAVGSSPAAGWTLFGLLFVSGLFAAIALTRAFIGHLWAPQGRRPPRLRLAEALPVALLLGGAIALVVRAEPALAYMRATAADLHEPQRYISAVQSARQVQGNADPFGRLRRPAPAREGGS